MIYDHMVWVANAVQATLPDPFTAKNPKYALDAWDNFTRGILPEATKSCSETTAGKRLLIVIDTCEFLVDKQVAYIKHQDNQTPYNVLTALVALLPPTVCVIAFGTSAKIPIDSTLQTLMLVKPIAQWKLFSTDDIVTVVPQWNISGVTSITRDHANRLGCLSGCIPRALRALCGDVTTSLALGDTMVRSIFQTAMLKMGHWYQIGVDGDPLQAWLTAAAYCVKWRFHSDTDVLPNPIGMTLTINEVCQKKSYGQLIETVLHCPTQIGVEAEKALRDQHPKACSLQDDQYNADDSTTVPAP